jgi:hypothetical protein
MIADQDIIDAIRQHPVIGRHTLSVIDECYSDQELVKEFSVRNSFEVWFKDAKPRRVQSVAEAVNLAVKQHKNYLEKLEDIIESGR